MNFSVSGLFGSLPNSADQRGNKLSLIDSWTPEDRVPDADHLLQAQLSLNSALPGGDFPSCLILPADQISARIVPPQFGNKLSKVRGLSFQFRPRSIITLEDCHALADHASDLEHLKWVSFKQDKKAYIDKQETLEDDVVQLPMMIVQACTQLQEIYLHKSEFSNYFLRNELLPTIAAADSKIRKLTFDGRCDRKDMPRYLEPLTRVLSQQQLLEELEIWGTPSLFTDYSNRPGLNSNQRVPEAHLQRFVDTASKHKHFRRFVLNDSVGCARGMHAVFKVATLSTSLREIVIHRHNGIDFPALPNAKQLVDFSKFDWPALLPEMKRINSLSGLKPAFFNKGAFGNAWNEEAASHILPHLEKNISVYKMPDFRLSRPHMKPIKSVLSRNYVISNLFQCAADPNRNFPSLQALPMFIAAAGSKGGAVGLYACFHHAIHNSFVPHCHKSSQKLYDRKRTREGFLQRMEEKFQAVKKTQGSHTAKTSNASACNRQPKEPGDVVVESKKPRRQMTSSYAKAPRVATVATAPRIAVTPTSTKKRTKKNNQGMAKKDPPTPPPNRTMAAASLGASNDTPTKGKEVTAVTPATKQTLAGPQVNPRDAPWTPTATLAARTEQQVSAHYVSSLELLEMEMELYDM